MVRGIAQVLFYGSKAIVSFAARVTVLPILMLTVAPAMWVLGGVEWIALGTHHLQGWRGQLVDWCDHHCPEI